MTIQPQISRTAIPATGQYDERQQTTALCLAVDFGARHDPASQGGAAHLLEHVLMSAAIGTGKSLSERVERLGGPANASTNTDRMFFQVQVRNTDVGEILAAMSDAVTRPRISGAVFAAERQAVLQELTAAAVDPSDQVQDAFLADLFPGHPLGRPAGGTIAAVRDLTLTDVLRVHSDAFLTSRMALAYAGGTPAAEIDRYLASTAFAGTALAGGSGETPLREDNAPLPELPADPRPVGFGTSPDGFSWVAVGGRAPSVDDSRRYAFIVLAHLLGSSSASLLYRRLRAEEGLVYSFFTWSRSYAESGAWRIVAGTQNEQVPRVRAITCELLSELAGEGPDPAALEVARCQAAMSTVLDAEKPWDLAVDIAIGTRFATRPWTVRGRIADLEAVTADDIRSAAADIAARLLTTVRPEAA